MALKTGAYPNENMICSNGFSNSSNLVENCEILPISKQENMLSLNRTKIDDGLVVLEMFVSEHKEVEKRTNRKRKRSSSKEDVVMRRNPVRLVRKTLVDLLHISHEEKKQEDKENKVPNKKRNQPAEEDPKAKKVTKNTINNKATSEAVLVRKNSKRKCPRRKHKPQVVEAKKVPVTKLKPLVNSTTKMLENFMQSYKETREVKQSTNGNRGICSFENRLDVLKYQTILFSLINEMDENQTATKLD